MLPPDNMDVLDKLREDILESSRKVVIANIPRMCGKSFVPLMMQKRLTHDEVAVMLDVHNIDFKKMEEKLMAVIGHDFQNTTDFMIGAHSEFYKYIGDEYQLSPHPCELESERVIKADPWWQKGVKHKNREKGQGKHRGGGKHKRRR